MSRTLGNLSKKTSNLPGWVLTAFSIAGLLIFFFLALQAVTSKSPTFDEAIHLLRGKVLWQSAALSVQGEHTPLSHWVIGTFFFTEPTLPYLDPVPILPEGESARLGWEFLWGHEIDVNRLLVIGRLPVVFVGLLLGALVVRWSKMLSGILGAIIVVALFAFSPNLLASTSVATTDLMATATFTATIFASWFYWRHPSLWRLVLYGIALGLALGSKLTAILLLPLTLLLAYANWFGFGPGKRRDGSFWHPGIVWLVTVLIAGLVLWSIYGFEVGIASGLPFPVPAATYVENFTQVQDHISRGHSSFLLGELSFGWWHYFIVAFLIKTPAVALVFLGLTIVYLIVSRRWRESVFVWLPVVVLLVVASYSRLNIGYRHILPMVPLIWVLISYTAPVWLKNRGLLLVLGAFLVLYAVGPLSYQPHFLAYFNEFVGGPAEGYKYLGDSNLDWGQDLQLVAEYVEQSAVEPNLIAHYGTGSPAYYGLTIPPIFDDAGNVIGIARANPAPGRYIISTSRLQGAYEYEPHLFDWFRRRNPDAQIGFTNNVYDVPESLPGSWIGHCLDPEPHLTNSQAEQLVGFSSRQHLFFDCRSSWLIPAGNEPGWYILPYDYDPENVRELFGEHLMLTYANAYSPKTQPYRVYYWDGDNSAKDSIMNRSALVTFPDGTEVNLPAAVNEAAFFLGGWRDENGWTSAWQAGSAPGQFLSVQMHLYVDGAPPLIGDGLGYPAAYWRKGDIIVQFHDFGLHPAGYLETGLYDYNSLAGLSFQDADRPTTTVRIIPE